MFADEAFAEACRRTTLKAHHGREDEKHWSFHVECAFKSVLLVMSQRSELESACALVRQVDERRRFLAKCRRKCGDAERKEGLA